jgi:hypothetical protein
MRVLIYLTLLSVTSYAYTQQDKPKATIEGVTINYKGKAVKAKKLIVHSVIPIDIDSAWHNVKTPALLEFVAKGMITFKPEEGTFPQQWKLHHTYGTKMRIFSFIPFGGVHYLYIERIDDKNHEIATKEWDRKAKVWNHNITIKQLSNEKIYYEDSIIIYGGIMTGIITSFAKRFYQHRQKRWQIVAEQHLLFST